MKLKKILASILCVAMVLSTMSFSVSAESTVSVWDGESYSLDWLSTGNPEGTEGDKYYLNSAEDLAGLAYYVNNYEGTNNIFTGDTVYLNVDVDLDNHDWAPIGTAYPREKNRFYGSFDGQGHTISNLKVEEGHYFAGLFGQIPTYNYTQTFSNITINNAVVVAADETETGKNKEAAGALIGRANGTIIDNCHVTGEVSISGDRFVGGLLGHSYAQISDCSIEASGTINADTWQAGGLVGAHGATAAYTSSIENCSVIGDTANGGLAVTSYYTAAGGAIGSVSVSGVDSTTIDGITVENVSVTATSDEYGAGLAEVASGYEATNTTVDNVVATVNVAKIGDVYYTSLKEAIKNAVAEDIIYLMNEINEGSIKLPATITNLTIDGQGTAVVKDTVITAADGNSVNYQGLTIKNTTFDNSRFVLGGMRTGDVIYKDLVFDNNTFKNIVADNSMAAVHMNIASEDNEYVENFSFINNTIDGVTGSSNSGVLMKNAKGNVVFDNNKISNVVNNAIQCINPKADINLVISNNTLSANLGSVVNLYNVTAVTLENNTITLNDGQSAFGFFSPVATIGNTSYTTLQGAVDAAGEGDTIVLMNDIEYEVNPTADSTSSDSNCLLHTDKDDVITLDLNGKTISVKGSDEAKYDTLAIRNNGTLTIVDNGNARSAGTISLAFDGTQEVGTSQIHSTILNFGTLTIDGGNIINTATTGYARHAIYNYSWGGNANLTVNNGYISSVGGNAIFQAIYDDFSQNTNNVTIEDGTFNGGVYSWYQGACAPDGASLTINGGEFTGQDYALRLRGMSSEVLKVNVQSGNFTAPTGVDAITVDAAASFISGGTFSSNVSAYAAEGFDVVRTADRYVVEAESAQADSISIEYKDITEADAEGEKTYEVVVKANDNDYINELASVDLTFAYTSAPVTGGSIDFTVLPAADFTMTRYENTNRYMLSYNGVSAYEGTDNAITIATITVTGYGEYTIATADVETNIVNATTVNDNLVDSYTAAGAADDDATTGGLVINTDTVADDGMVGEITDGNIAVPTRTLTVKIDFPNAVVDNAVAYQDMKVEITGNIDGVNKTVTYNLGEDEIAMVDGSYVVTEDALVLNNAYTVTVSGAGYRTARYTVTMTEDKTLRFWNNVMDEAQVVEIGKASSDAKVTFLAGDIVKDNNINIYDLSAVVSYFGTEDCVNDYPEYAKYDLNRDGVIDSKDVAYVLVSWNN